MVVKILKSQIRIEKNIELKTEHTKNKYKIIISKNIDINNYERKFKFN